MMMKMDQWKSSGAGASRVVLLGLLLFAAQWTTAGDAKDYQAMLKTGLLCKESKLVNEAIDHVNLNEPLDLEGFMPLQNAVIANNEELVKLFITKGAAVNSYDQVGNTPLGYAAANREFGLVRLLLQHGAEINLRMGRDNLTALHLAVLGASCASDEPTKDHLKTLTILLENGADLNAKTEKKKTPIDLAIERKLLPIADMLKNYQTSQTLKTKRQD